MSSELREFTGLPGMVVQLQGIALPNDGLGGWFYWNPAGTEPDDNYSYIVPYGSGTGEWVRLNFPLSTSSGIFSDIIVNFLSQLQGDVIIGGILSQSLAPSISATGSSQSTAFPLVAQINIATNVSPGTGFILPIITPTLDTIKSGTTIQLLNRGASIASLYPPIGGSIEGLSTNSPVGVAPGGTANAVFAGPTQWWIA
jgi:hypothetical protein